MSNIDLAASIIPKTSAGGYTLGADISSIEELNDAILIDSFEQSVSRQLLMSEGWKYVEARSEDENLCYRKTFYYKNDLIRLQFNSTDVLYCIYILNGYQGIVFDKIGIGSRLSDLKELFEVEYDSGNEMYYPSEKSEVKGISFYINERFTEDGNIDSEISTVAMICIHN